tara:strand:+ start:22131 stop:23699 length:1569 start_codon:yes stop_codon:yes gene_type:complete
MNLKLLFPIFLLFISCSSNFNNENLSIFKYNESSGVYTLDPAFSKDQATVNIANQIFNGLVQLDNHQNVIPSIAMRWEVSENNLNYKFYLRDDVFFHDHILFKNGLGRRVVADDFVYSLNRLKDTKLASPGAWVLSNVDTFSALNDSVLLIKVKKPFPGFLSLLAMKYCSVVPKEIVQGGSFHNHPIGTGPFKFQLWVNGVKLILRKNNNYFESYNGKKLPFLDAISITFIKDKQSAFLQFLQGNLDYLSGIDASYKDELLTNSGTLNTKYASKINLLSSAYLNTEYLGFLMNEDTLPIEIRKAINYGFDRDNMIKYLRNNIGTPAINGIIPPGIPSYNPNVTGYDYNLDKAISLINNSKFNKSKTITLSTTSSYLDLCEYIQSCMKDIGLNIKIDVNPPSTHRQLVATSKLSFFRGSWIADYPDGENYLSLFYSENFTPRGPNYTHFQNTKYDSLYRSALSEKNDSIRHSIYNKMDKIIIENSVIVPLYYDRVLCFLQKNITGFKVNSRNLLELKTVSKNK